VLDDAAHPDLTKLAAGLLRGIDHRGGDATGYACFGPERLHMQKAACAVRPFLDEWRGVPIGTRTVLLHTRLATQGAPAFPENNHPVVNGSVYVVHNGHISNDGTIFAKGGRERLGRVDSEAIPAAIVEASWDKADEALERLQGAFAIAAVDTKRPGELMLARSGWSPLVYFRSRSLLVWASEAAAIGKAWQDAFGTAPSWDRFETLEEGSILRVRAGAIARERFTVKREPFRPAAYHWSACHTSQTVTKPLRLAQGLESALAGLATPKRTEPSVDETDYWLTAEVRCACCDQWEPWEATVVMLNERLCQGCADMLLDLEEAPLDA
jgi:asparagine synthetase B (glutamine-hydrolysing)